MNKWRASMHSDLPSDKWRMTIRDNTRIATVTQQKSAHVKTAYLKGPVASVYVDNWWNMKVLKGCHFHRQTVQLLSLVTLFWGDKGTLENSTGIKIGKGDWATVSAGGSAASQILFGIGVVSTKLFGQSDIKDSGWVPGSTDPPRSLY